MILVCTASIASYHNMYSVYMYIFQHCTQTLKNTGRPGYEAIINFLKIIFPQTTLVPYRFPS